MTRTAFYSYLGVAMTIIATGMGFPIPEEIPVVSGGILAAHPENEVRWWIMLPVSICAVVIGDGLLYGIGRLWGRKLLEIDWLRKRLLPADRLSRIEENFHKSGVMILLYARLLPGIRSPIFLTAGLMRLPIAKFLLADGIYAVPGVSLLFWLAYFFTDQFLEFVQKAESIKPLIIVLVIVGVSGYLVYHFWKSPVTTGDPAEIPLLGPHKSPGSDPAADAPKPVEEPKVGGPADGEMINSANRG